MKRWLIVLAAAAFLSGCGYNKIQNQDEDVKKEWSEVLNQYQRRADLVPNLVATVKGFAAQEERVLVEVTQARAKVGSIQLTPELINDPAAFAKFQAAQGELTSALSRLMVVAERYPDLKSNQNFRDLQVQLEGTENRVAVARNRYIDAVRGYNVTIREFVRLLAQVRGWSRPCVSWPLWPFFIAAWTAELRSLVKNREPYPSLQHLRLSTRRWHYSSARARSELGYETRPLLETLKDAHEWFCGTGQLDWRTTSPTLPPAPRRAA